MASQDYDEIEKIFAGKWIYDKDDENIEAFLKADGKKVLVRQQNSYFSFHILKLLFINR